MAVRKSGLGRGLDGMFPSYVNKEKDTVKEKNTKAVSEKKEKSTVSQSQSKRDNKTENKEEKGVVLLKTSLVEPNKDQPRKLFNEDALQELADSVKQFGIIQPIVVQKREDYYEIIAGERRWRAAKLAGLKEIPVVIRDFTDQQIMEVSLIENIQREDLNPIEEAKAYQRLLQEYDLKQDEVAERVSKSRAAITNALRLLKLDPRVQQMLIDEKITSGHARALLGIENLDQQYEAAVRVFDEHLSVRDVEKLVKDIQNPKIEKPKKPVSEALELICRQMEDKMKGIFGTKVVINRQSDKKGKIEITYCSNEELERIYDLLREISSTYGQEIGGERNE